MTNSEGNLISRTLHFFIKNKFGRIPLVRKTYHLMLPLFKSLLKKTVIEIHGNTMYLDSKDSLSLSIYGTFEPAETQIVQKTIKSGDTIIDVGANIGYYTLQFAKLSGPKGKVFAFEPFPENYAILKKNVELNKYSNVQITQKAVSDSTGSLNLYVNKSNNGMHSIVKSLSSTITVETITLDEFFINSDIKIDFIKIDIEGAELRALKGMSGLLRKQESIQILLEFAPKHMESPANDSKELLLLLQDHGFIIQEIEDSGSIVTVTIEELLSKYSANNNTHTNLLCSKK